MIENIVEYLSFNGFNVSVENGRVVTIHSHAEKEFKITGEIDSMLERKLPIFYLQDRSKFGSLAHVGWDNDNDEGRICEGTDINRHIDFSNPPMVYRKALEYAEKIIINDLSDSENNRQEIIKEFTAHWRHAAKDDNFKVISFIEPGTLVEEIMIYNPITSSNRNLPFFIKGQADHINREYEYLNKLMKGSQSRGKAIYLPVCFSLLPPNPTTKLVDWWLELIQKLPLKMQSQLKDIARRNHSHDFWVLGSIKLNQDSHGWFCILFSNTSKKIPPLFDNPDISTWEAVAYDVKIHSKEYIVPRGGSTLYKKENTLAIVGCGSVGAEVARQLVSSGINNLWLVDFDILSIENIYRHFLNPEHIGSRKSVDLALDLKKRYPYTNATVVSQNSLDSCLTDDFLSNIDGIIVATGSPTEERFFNEELFKSNHRPWVIYCWVEGHGVGGHAVYVHNSGKGCLNCIYRDNDGYKSLESIYSFLKSQQNIAIDISGCGTHFLPYSFTDAIQTAILATRLALLAIEEKLSASCLISWKSNYANQMELKTSYRYKTFENSLNVEPLYWENCDVCNK